jgi:hypothetical protein
LRFNRQALLMAIQFLNKERSNELILTASGALPTIKTMFIVINFKGKI